MTNLQLTGNQEERVLDLPKEVVRLRETQSNKSEHNYFMTETPVTDSANNSLTDDADQAPAGLDSLLASVLSGVEEPPKKRGRKKKGVSAEPEPIF